MRNGVCGRCGAEGESDLQFSLSWKKWERTKGKGRGVHGEGGSCFLCRACVKALGVEDWGTPSRMWKLGGLPQREVEA